MAIQIDSYLAGDLFLTLTQQPDQWLPRVTFGTTQEQFAGSCSATLSGSPLCQVVNLTFGLTPMALRTSLLPTRVHTFTYWGPT